MHLNPTFGKRMPGAILPIRMVALCSTILMSTAPAYAQSHQDDEVIVTATRRDQTIQEVPLNIAFVGADQLEEQNITDLADIASWVPGFHIINSGGREQDGIVIRGLNADGLGIGDNGTVATYIGEIPLQVDLKLNDMERVEILLGPQGTLYGAGTMGGAVRYLPNKPALGQELFEVRADTYGYSEGGGVSTDLGFTANVPVGENFALRATFDVLNDDGFIDYTRVVRQIGVSNPDPDFSNPADVDANLRTVKDANYEDTLSMRFAARWAPAEWLDATATYYGQFQKVGGRTHNGVEAVGTGRYESGTRVLEPNDRDNELLALEITADLGFAELTSATGVGEYDELGNRDQTDLLVGLGYSYESFPSFTAITEEAVRQKFISQEVRLVSKGDHRYNWIVGAFYNDSEAQSYSHEFTPNYPFAVFLGRENFLEYDAFTNGTATEKAVFGEVGFDITDAWQVTAGGRYYDYDIQSGSDALVVFFDTAPSYQGSTLDEIEQLDFNPLNDASGDGTLFKFNTSYKFTDDINMYATISEGFRLGGSNGIKECPATIDPTVQNLCALPSEANYKPDTTTNYEIGLRTQWFDKRLTLNGSVYNIDWDGIQLSGTTIYGTLPIIQNGASARSRGFELSLQAKPTDRFSVRGNYAYTDAKLTADAPNLYSSNGFYGVVPDATDSATCPVGVDDRFTEPTNPLCLGAGGKDGDRLPGSPKHQFSVFTDYEMPLSDSKALVFNYGLSYTGDILARVGNIANGDVLDSYSISNASIILKDEAGWDVSVYVTNLFDKYAVTNLTGTRASIQTYSDEDGGIHAHRGFRPNVLPPRVIGARLNYRFGG